MGDPEVGKHRSGHNIGYQTVPGSRELHVSDYKRFAEYNTALDSFLLSVTDSFSLNVLIDLPTGR